MSAFSGIHPVATATSPSGLPPAAHSPHSPHSPKHPVASSPVVNNSTPYAVRSLDLAIRELTQQASTFMQNLTTAVESGSLDSIRHWVKTYGAAYLEHTDKRCNTIRDLVVACASGSSSQNNNSNVNLGGGAASANSVYPMLAGGGGDNAITTSASGRVISPQNVPAFGTMFGSALHLLGHPMATNGEASPRNRLHSLDTLAGDHSTAIGSQVVSRPGSLRLQPRDGEQSSENDHAQHPSRPGSFTNRYGSFARKQLDGVDVPVLRDEASDAVVDALNDTYSMASRGSWRRRAGPPSLYSMQQNGGPGSANGVQALGNIIKRRAYLSFINLDGMPNLNIEADQQDLRSRFSRPSTRHTAVFRNSGDLESLLDECNIPRIHDINSLEFNVFDEYQRYGDFAFTVIVMNVLLKYSFVTSFKFRLPNLLTFCKTVQSFYRSENPFHNALHAADVVQTTHLYLCQRDVKENFSDVELFALLFSAMSLDVGHLGVNDQFLTKTRHPLATLYNDTTPMEAMSCALAFCIFDDPDCNFVSESEVWDREVETEFRELVTDLMLRSHDGEHTNMCNDVDAILAQGKIGHEAVPQLLCAVLHAADVSFMCKPRHIYLEWACRQIAENYRQGDAEAEYASIYSQHHPEVPVDSETKWLKISKLCDRSITCTELQSSTMQHIMLPFISLLRPFLPSIWVERLEANFHFLQEEPEEKLIVFENGVQEQLWKKGIATTWSDVDPASGKNFLSVIRSWIAAELPDDMYIKAPSKLVVTNSGSMSSGGNNNENKGNNTTTLQPVSPGSGEDSRKSSACPSTEAQSDTLRVNAVGTQPKRRLSQAAAAPPSNPTVVAGLSAVHVLTSEMLKHMHTLLNSSGSRDMWDREKAIFAQEWVTMLRTLEAQDSGPALLSTFVMSQPPRAAQSGEEESIAIVSSLRDQNAPFAHFKPPKPQSLHQSALHNNSGTMGGGGGVGETGSSARRDSLSDMFVSNAPFACAILLTQMWWVLYTQMQEEQQHASDAHGPLSTPPDAGYLSEEDELSVSQKDRLPPLEAAAIPSSGRRNSPKHQLEQQQKQQQGLAIPASTSEKGARSATTALGVPPLSSCQASGGRTAQSSETAPSEPQLSSPVNNPTPPLPSAPSTGSARRRPSENIAPDPSPVKYVLQRRSSKQA